RWRSVWLGDSCARDLARIATCTGPGDGGRDELARGRVPAERALRTAVADGRSDGSSDLRSRLGQHGTPLGLVSERPLLLPGTGDLGRCQCLRDDLAVGMTRPTNREE